MKVTLWGTRGSLASPGPETLHYGGNTSCVEVKGADGTILILDAGTGIRRLGMTIPDSLKRVDILLTHLHMDHIQGLGFFAPLRNPQMEVHIWGPASTTLSLRSRLMRYLSPPLFPVRLKELPCILNLHEVPCGDFEVGEFRISASLVCHPGPTVGYRIASSSSSTITAYLPDHEPALGWERFPADWSWVSGYSIASKADLLIHDAQYSSKEYPNHIGWGHSSIHQAIEFASIAQVKNLVLFHHNPAHDDKTLTRLIEKEVSLVMPTFRVTPASEGAVFNLSPD